MADRERRKEKTASKSADSKKLIAAFAITMTIILALLSISPVSGLSIVISNPSPTYLGQTISFSITVTVEDSELLPIRNVDLEIYNVSYPATYHLSCDNLPLTAENVQYNTEGGLVEVQAVPGAGWGYGYGYGYVDWQGIGHYFGYGYGFAPAFITYNVTWHSPSTWPGGNYEIKATVATNGHTFTKTKTVALTVPAVPPTPDFSVSVSPASASVMQGGSTTATVSVTSIAGFTNTVSLSTSGLPSGASATFSPASGTPSFTSTMRITTASTTPVGTYTITITGTGGGKTHSTTFTLTVEAVIPGKATLTVDTTPIKGRVYVDGSLWGIAPQTRQLNPGTHVVAFGDYLGYLTPPPQRVTLAENENRTVTGVYTQIPVETVENQSPTYDLPSLRRGENATVRVENTVISEITLEAENDISGARVTVQQFTERPTGIAIGAPGVTYRYLNIVTENLTDAQVRSVTIRFSVEKSWIAANRIDISTITLNRYDPATSTWTPLPTTLVGEDEVYAYFSAVSPGLSVFAISGQPVQPVGQFPWKLVIITIGIVIIAMLIILRWFGLPPFRKPR